MSNVNNPETNMPQLQPNIDAAIAPVGEESLSVITKIRSENGEYATGNILRRTCEALGAGACAQVCALRNADPQTYVSNTEKLCADGNLRDAFEGLAVSPSEVVMVAVTGDRVGFGDELENYQSEGVLKQNPEGWRELPGFNAFFARATEVPAIGRRLADCADFNFEFHDSDGNLVIGFEHGTRPNTFGEGVLKFEKDGSRMTYTELVLRSAIEHYGVDPSDIKIRLSSAIKAENFVKNFKDREAMEAHVPGWLRAGWLNNVTNPAWKPGDEVTEKDEWHADFRGIVLHDVNQAMERLDIPHTNLDDTGMIDPVESGGVHSSYEKRKEYGDYRDLYLTVLKSATKS